MVTFAAFIQFWLRKQIPKFYSVLSFYQNFKTPNFSNNTRNESEFDSEVRTFSQELRVQAKDVELVIRKMLIFHEGTILWKFSCAVFLCCDCENEFGVKFQLSFWIYEFLLLISSFEHSLKYPDEAESFCRRCKFEIVPCIFSSGYCEYHRSAPRVSENSPLWLFTPAFSSFVPFCNHAFYLKKKQEF